MSNVDSKNKLKMVIGGVKYELPLYDSYNDFYNKKYATILLSNGDIRYIGLTPDRSDLTVNAGCYLSDKKHYFLIREITSNSINAGGSFWQYIANSQTFQYQKIISTMAYAPESGIYRVVFKIKWSGSYNDYHNYRYNSFYRFTVKQGDKVLADTGEHSLAESIFYPYSTGNASQSSQASVAKWMTLGEQRLYLKAGSNAFDLWLGMRFDNNKHAAAYVSPFQVEATYLNSNQLDAFYDDGIFKCPDNVDKINVIMAGGGGGGGALVRVKYKSYSEHSTNVSYSYGSNDGSDGQFINREIAVTPNASYPVFIGKGGAASTDNLKIELGEYTFSTPGNYAAGDGKDGTATTAFGLTANGGKGGYGGLLTIYDSHHTREFIKRPPTTTESANGGKGGSLVTQSWGGIFDRYTGDMKNASNGGNGYVKIEYSKN